MDNRNDGNGNLIEQTGAKGRKIGLGDVIYTYDDTSNGNFGRGLRTGMSDPTGSAAWRYDQVGQVLEEAKSLTGLT